MIEDAERSILLILSVRILLYHYSQVVLISQCRSEMWMVMMSLVS